jgi:hypothetical protein
MKIFSVLFAILLTASAAISYQADDARMARLLVGKWRGVVAAQTYTGQGTETVHMVYDAIYDDNGSFDITTSYASSTGTLVIVAKGDWSIVNGLLDIVYRSVDNPQYSGISFDLLGNGQNFYPFKNNQVPAPADFEIHFLNANTFQGSDGVVYRRVAG